MDDPTSNPKGGHGAAIVALIVLAVTSTGCRSTYLGTTASSFMRTVREDPDPNVRYLAYGKLASDRCYDRREQKSEAIALLVANLRADREPVASRAVICRTLGDLGDPAARQALIEAVGDPEAVVRAEACRALGKVGLPEDGPLLTRIMVTDVIGDCRVAAIEGLASLKSPEPRINAQLVLGMEHDDPAIRLASLDALREITGRDLGVEAGPWRDLLRGETPED